MALTLVSTLLDDKSSRATKKLPPALHQATTSAAAKTRRQPRLDTCGRQASIPVIQIHVSLNRSGAQWMRDTIRPPPYETTGRRVCACAPRQADLDKRVCRNSRPNQGSYLEPSRATSHQQQGYKAAPDTKLCKYGLPRPALLAAGASSANRLDSSLPGSSRTRCNYNKPRTLSP